jgi:hypothetical protein
VYDKRNIAKKLPTSERNKRAESAKIVEKISRFDAKLIKIKIKKGGKISLGF